jgi:hypothetical protein
VLNGSLTPAVSTAVLLAAGGLHLYRRRGSLGARAIGAVPV